MSRQYSNGDICFEAEAAQDTNVKRGTPTNRPSKPCHRCADYELILDINFCPYCGFEFIRG
jgi:hypothetical protein